MNLYELTIEAADYPKRLHDWLEQINPLLAVSGQHTFLSEEITNIDVGEQWIHINQGRWHGARLPTHVLFSSDPIRASTRYGYERTIAENAEHISLLKIRIEHCSCLIKKAEAELAKLEAGAAWLNSNRNALHINGLSFTISIVDVW